MERGCQPTTDCPYFGSCHEDTHHEYWPKRDYQTKVEKVFRTIHKVELCRRVHEELHATQLPPEKPEYEVMVQDILSAEFNIPRSLRRELRAGR